MLKRIAVLNSRVYGKAEIRLDDCDSLQLVGPNNIGKSTLIYALNFLFIIDGNKMTFSGQRKGDKETIHHYFPTPNQSYLIFEICKKEHYCILVKRDSEGDLEYYRFDQPYNENIFFEVENKQQRLLRFEEVKERLASNGIQLNQFKNKAEVFGTVYQRGRNNEGAVWLEDNVKSDGLSNNFSKVYRYLINSKLINNKTLKEALVIADNRDNEGLNFSQKNKKDILDLLKINNEIRNIKAIRNEFFDFREIVNQYHARAKVVNQLYFAFTNSYAETLPELDEHVRIRTSEINTQRTEINEILYPRKQELDREIGAKGSDIRNMQHKFDEKEALFKQVSKIEPVDFLKIQLENLEKERSEVEYQLNTVEKQKFASQQAEEKLNRIQSKIDRLEKQIRDYDNLLIHKISDNPEVKTLLNSVFSGQILSLTKEDIKKQIKKPTKNLKIFDGEIDITNIELREIESIELLQIQVDELHTEKNELLKLLQVIRERELYQHKLSEINKKLQLVRKNIELATTLPKLQEEIKTLIAGLDKLKNEKELLEKELNSLTGEIVKKSNSTSQLIEEKNKLETRIKELQGWKSELEMYSIMGEEYHTSEGLETLYRKIKISHADRTELKSRKDRLFDKLREKLGSIIADETSFIKYVEEEIACINDKEKSIDGLLQSISTQFANPAHTLLRRFEEFKYFVYNRFNNKLSRTRISDIESLQIELIENKKLMDEIRKISAIQELKDQLILDFDQSDSLRVLNQYLDSSRKVSFDELFDIELHLTLKGTTKKVDLSNQVESDGTDRMIRLVIIMSIINRLAINDEENRIALFIDEVATIDKHNRPELVNFCREHNFIPIFAAPDPVPGFSKYYYITPNPNQKLIVNERHALHARSKEPVRSSRRKHDEEGFFAEAALQIEVN